MSRSQKLLNNSFILLVGTILTKGINFVMAPLFTRWLKMEDYGTFDLIVTYSTLLIPIVSLGIHHAVFRFLLDCKTKEEITSVNTNSIIINLIGIIIYVLIISILAICFDSIKEFAFQLTILFTAHTLQNYIGELARGLKKLKLYTILNVICTISILIFVYIFVKLLNMNLNGMILGYSIAYVIVYVIGLISTKGYNFIKFNKINFEKTKELLKYAIHMIPYSISWWIINISDRVIVSVILGSTSNAILAVSHKLPNLLITLYDVFQIAWLENVSESIKDNDWNEYFTKMINTLFQICISISIVIITTNFFLYDLLFTKEYIVGKYLTPLFAFAIIFNALSQALGTVFVAEYNSKKQSITMIVSGIINILVHLLTIKYIGIYASAVSTIIAYIFLFVIRYKEITKEYKIKIYKKTYSLLLICILCICTSYINNIMLNAIMLVGSIILCFKINNNIILIIMNKILKKSLRKEIKL